MRVAVEENDKCRKSAGVSFAGVVELSCTMGGNRFCVNKRVTVRALRFESMCITADWATRNIARAY